MSHPTADLDELVHQRARLGILAVASSGDRVEFGYLKDALGLSAGNLSTHLTTLVKAGLVTVEKGYQGRRPRTWVSITKVGRRAYDGEMAILRSLVALQDVTRRGHSDAPAPNGPGTPADDDPSQADPTPAANRGAPARPRG
jgi:DNA-binding MarR family transcriptional regulator